MDEKTRREVIRQAYNYRCGYCHVHEDEIGSKLEIDHFQPRSVGGSDDLNNLVYCCSTCNRIKGDFWPASEFVNTSQHLLHPKQNDLAAHFSEEIDGYLTPLTEIGAFHIQRLRLNRLPLVSLRRTRQEVTGLKRELIAAQLEQTRLQERITSLERELEETVEQLTRLLGS